MQNNTYENFVQELLATAPETRGIYQKHLEDNGEALPHVFLGDVTRFVIDSYRTTNTGLLSRLLDFLERAVSSPDDKLQELVVVSFLENLHQAGEDYEGVKRLLGPNLRKNLSLVEG
ncbi:MAG: hypothetical protein HYV14_18275 [Elusimicrobia bacterium]|nr:hypothetical protein [Elusimicrobiota bacterium]